MSKQEEIESELFKETEAAKAESVSRTSSSDQQDSTGSFRSGEKSQQEACELLLEHFLPDDKRCIYFPRERFLVESKRGSKQKEAIIEIVDNLRSQHLREREERKLEDPDIRNVIVGAVLLIRSDDDFLILPIEKNDQESNLTDLEIIRSTILENYKAMTEKLGLLQKSEYDLLTSNRKESFQRSLMSYKDQISKEEASPSYLEILDRFIDLISRSNEYSQEQFNDYGSKAETLSHLPWGSKRSEASRFIAQIKEDSKQFMKDDYEQLKKLKSQIKLYENAIVKFDRAYKPKGILLEKKLDDNISLIRGHSESELVSKIDITTLEGYDPSTISNAYILFVSTNEICSACTNVIPQIKQKAAQQLKLDEKGKVQLLYFSINQHKDGQLYIKRSENEMSYQRRSSSALAGSQVLMDSKDLKDKSSDRDSKIEVPKTSGFFSQSMESRRGSATKTSGGSGGSGRK